MMALGCFRVFFWGGGGTFTGFMGCLGWSGVSGVGNGSVFGV